MQVEVFNGLMQVFDQVMIKFVPLGSSICIKSVKSPDIRFFSSL